MQSQTETSRNSKIWNGVVVPDAREVALNFINPAADYSVIQWWHWKDEMSEERVVEELDRIKSLGVFSVLINAGYGAQPRYLSPDWFERIRFALEQANTRNMRVWIADEGSYPSGFAGGKFNSDYPDQRMKVLAVAQSVDLAQGQGAELKLSPDTVCAAAVELATGKSISLDISGEQLAWEAPEGDWRIVVIERQFRTSPTRYVHHPERIKDTTYSLCDYLDPAATECFIKEVHEQYKKYIEPYFGTTMMGFFGDEPDYSISSCIPWTPRIFEEFEKLKGYDVRPYIPWFFVSPMPEDGRRAKADYWDVWSDMFKDNFFRVQAEWCEKNNLLYIVHLNHEDDMMGLTRSEGDFFKCMRHVPVPAVDAIWRQIWMDKTADFPKLASSAAHLFGRPRAFTESFAVYGCGLSIEQIKWVIFHQFVRGINLVLSSNFLPHDNPQSTQFPILISYINRISHMLSLGKPTAKIALYLPTLSMWLGDENSLKNTLSIARQLLEHQRDFDFVDDGTLSSGLSMEGGTFKNLSGQAYGAVVIPEITTVSAEALERLRAFRASGGCVVCAGRYPSLSVDKAFLTASEAPALDWAVQEPSGVMTQRMLEILPSPDVLLNVPCPDVKYLHRRWHNADVYFFFNESDKRVLSPITVEGYGKAQCWDAETACITDLTGKCEDGRMQLTLELEAYQAKVIVIGEDLPEASAVEEPVGFDSVIAELSGEWTIDINGEQKKTYLQPWADMGYPAYSGSATYRKEFIVSEEELSGNRRFFLECEKVLYSAQAWLNGNDLGARAWRPFCWEVTGKLKAGKNILEIEVRNTPAAAFAGDPVRLERLKEEISRNYYLGIYLKFDMEMVPSGLLPDVKLKAYNVL